MASGQLGACDVLSQHRRARRAERPEPHSLLSSLGALGVFLVLFAETGLLIGFFLPGDSLLFTAGLLCATHSGSTLHLSLPAVLVAAAAGALLGAQTGYAIGRAAGPNLIAGNRHPRLQTAADRVGQAINRYGLAKAVVLSRFIPVVRTVVNPVLGALRSPLRPFVIWQVAGGLLWSLGVTIAGWQLGSHIANVDHYLLPIVALVVIVSLIPVLLEARRGQGELTGRS